MTGIKPLPKKVIEKIPVNTDQLKLTDELIKTMPTKQNLSILGRSKTTNDLKQITSIKDPVPPSTMGTGPFVLGGVAIALILIFALGNKK